MIKLIFFMVDDNPQLEKISGHYAKDELFECVHVSKDEVELIEEIEGAAILIFGVDGRDSLTNSLKILKNHYKHTRAGLIKTACFLKMENKKVEKALAKLGCREFLESNINERSLKFKIDFWSKSLINHIKQAQQTERVVQTQDSQENKSSKKAGFDFETVEPLNSPEDLWLNSRANLCKKILRTIMLRFVGPCQGAVYWKEVSTLDSGDQLYTLVYGSDKVKMQIFDGEEITGEWYYQGSKPEYDWDTDEWLFTGQQPKLYYQEGDQVKTRFNFDETGRYITSTSPLANRKLPVYFDLKKNAHTFGQEKKAEQRNAAFEADESNKLKDLEGSGKTEHIDQKNMEGKSSTDDLGSSNMEGKSSTDDLGGNLEGESSTDAINDQLEGKSSTDAINDQLEGKSSTDAINDQLEGKSSTDAINDQLEGKNKTDRLDRSNYKNRETEVDDSSKDQSEDDNVTGIKFSPHDKKKGKASQDPLITNKGQVADPERDMKEMTEAPSVHISLSHQIDNLVKTTEGTLVEWNEEEFCVMSDAFEVEEIESLTVFVDVRYDGQNYKFKLLGKINGMTPSDNGEVTYYLTLDEKYDDEREQFIEVYAQRQSHINMFMKLAKGL